MSSITVCVVHVIIVNEILHDMIYSTDAGTSVALSTSVLSSFMSSSHSRIYFSSATKTNKPSLQTITSSLLYVTNSLHTGKRDGKLCV